MAEVRKGTGLFARLALAWVHLLVLWAFAFAKPLFDVLADSPDFFVVRGNSAGDILLLAFGVTLVPPTLLVGLELPFVLVERVRWSLHVVIVGGLAAALGLQVLEDASGGPLLVLVIGAVALGAGAASLYARVPAARSTLTVLAPAPFVFLAWFLFFSSVATLVLPQSEDSSAAESKGARAPLVLVVLDEFSGYSLVGRRGDIDARRYPNFAALAAEATWYPNATTVTDGTTHAVPAILSGRVPAGDVAPVIAEYPQNLFTVLGKRYRFNVNEPASDLCPRRLCANEAARTARGGLRSLVDDLSVVSLHLLLPDALDDRLPAVDQTFGNFGDDERGLETDQQSAPGSGIPAGAFEDPSAQWRRATARVKRSPKRPTLTFAHVLLPHFPWQHVPTGQEYPTAGPAVPGTDGDVWSSHPGFARQAEQRYLLQLGYVDRLLGELLRELRKERQYHRALIIVTADHGIAFRPGLPRREVTEKTFTEIASVPLFVKTPGQHTGRRDDRLARTVDILPTIADALGIELEEIDGRSLLAPPRSPSSLTIFALDASDATLTAEVFKRRRETLWRAATHRWGAGSQTGLFEGAAEPGLIGADTRRLAPLGVSRARIRLDAPRLFTSVDPRAKLIPAFVTGVITGEVDVGDRFAVALNGRIAGVGSAYEDGSETRLGAMVSPGALRRGTNRVEVYAMSGHGENIRLVHVPRNDNTFDAQLVQQDGVDVIKDSAGRTTPVVPGALTGFVDSLAIDGNAITASGWAIDPKGRRVADRVLMFAGGRLIADGRPSAPRPDIAREFGEKLERSGFRLEGALRAEDDGRRRIRVLAIAGRGASELERAPR